MTFPTKRVPSQAGLDRLNSNPQAAATAYSDAVTRATAFVVMSAEAFNVDTKVSDEAAGVVTTIAEGVQVLVANTLSQHIDMLDSQN